MVDALAAANHDVARVAREYALPVDAVRAAMVFYRRYRDAIDAHARERRRLWGLRLTCVANLHFDADVKPTFRFLLEERTHTVLTTQALGRAAALDAEQLVTATRLDRILVTHNGKDFRTLCQAWSVWRRVWGLEPTEHAGVIAITLQSLLSYPHAARQIHRLLEQHEPIWNQLWCFDLQGNEWVRQV